MNSAPQVEPVRLGLIGDNIAQSQAPRLHELAGRLLGVPVTYERLVPRDLDQDFEGVFRTARARGFRGLNITYPYKERVVPLVRISDPQTAALGAVNTVLFTPEGPRGHNTDRSGFIAAYRHVLGSRIPGPVCIVGGGGVGKAVAFGLLSLGLRKLAIVERDLTKAAALGRSLKRAAPGLEVRVSADVSEGVSGAAGIANCTPVGMVGHEGTPVPGPLMRGATWAFDAVYTPVETRFLSDASACGLAIVSGWELYFYQGQHAVSIFHGQPIDEGPLRKALSGAA